VEGKTENGVYAGSLQRIYVFAEGEAADFAAQHFNRQVSCFIDYGFYQLNNDVTPACTVLIHPSVDMPAEKAYDYDIPMVAVSPAQEAQAKEALANLVPETGCCGVVNGEFDAETILPLYHSQVSAVRRQSGMIVSIPDLEALGLRENVTTRSLTTGDMTCYEYTSNQFDSAAEGSVPVVFMFHGGGNHAQYFAWASGWMEIAAENNLYLVSVDKHVDRTSADVVELLGLLEAEYPQIDKSRIYATGFSMGAVKCWNLAIKYPELFAGVLPCDAGYAAEGDQASSDLNGITIEPELEMKQVIIPLFYVAGGRSFTHEDVALDDQGNMNNVGVILQRIFAMNQVDDNYFYDAEKNVNWGIVPVSVETVQEPVFHADMEISSFASKDGAVYMKLCFDVTKGHENYPQDGVEGWNFIRHFSRAEDGTLIME
jgi:pimeloyl-ACP methyl ester carboxylesterase